MTEIVSAAASVISIVLELSKGLYKEVNFLKGVEDGIQQLKNRLRHMKACLKDVDELEMSNAFREWVSDVQELAYDAEDIIDTFSHTSGLETTHAGSWRIPFPSSRTFSRRTHILGRRLENLKEDAEKIQRWRAHYADISITTDRRKKPLENLKELREDSSLYDDTIRERMVGLEDTIDFLANKLTSGGSDRHFAMSILGMGGLGKTTLARRLYNKLSKGVHFEARAWICVSKEYDAKKMLQQLIKEIIKPETESRKLLEDLSTSKHSVTDYLYKYLEERSFLVVLDDVWEIAAWDIIRRAFPLNNPNGTIIITTRDEDVAKINGAYAHKLRRLDANESWELFCRKSVPNGNGLTECPAYLKTVGTEMVNKCDGLPLALVTLGGLLSRKSPEISEWEAVRDNLWVELKKGSLLIDAVLTLSYIDLDYNLKRCFLYLGMYPEDFDISVYELMLLWEAEGLIGQEKGRPEDIAKMYFKELVRRSLIQYVGCDIVFCRIHDLLRDLAITKAEEIGFLAFEDAAAAQPSGLLNKAQPGRRLAMSNVHPSTIRHDYVNGRLRTFRLRLKVSMDDRSKDSSYIPVDELLRSIDARFNLLRVLDIVVLGSVTNLQVGDMIHLRYLKINCPEVELPENIGNLKALQTLSIITNKLTFPKTMGKLQKLKHMIRDHYHSPFDGEDVIWIGNITWIGKLTCLETLCIQSDKWGEIDDTTSLINLRHLTVNREDCYYPEPDSKFYSNLKSLTRLHTLDFSDLESCYVSYFEVFKHCPSIRHFSGRISSDIHDDIHEYALNLKVLELAGAYHRTFILLPSIQKLPKLRVLKLGFVILPPDFIHAIFGPAMPVMDCSKDGFAQLQTLHIAFDHYGGDNNPQMELKVADGGLPLLTKFHVNIPQILIAPDRLKQLITVAP